MKKLLCLLLSLLMLLSAVPALAEDAEPSDEPAVSAVEPTAPAEEDDPAELSAPANEEDDPAELSAPAEEDDPAEIAVPAEEDDPAEPAEEPAPEPAAPVNPEDEPVLIAEEPETVLPESDPDAQERYLELNETNFPDENLRFCLVVWFSPYGDAETGYYFTREQVENVTYFQCQTQSIQSMKGIELFPNLTTLDCAYNSLTELDVSGLPALKALSCGGNELTALDVSHNLSLTSLSCGGNELTALDVSANTALESLYCYSNELTALDVSGNPALYYLSCQNNHLTALRVSGASALATLYCYGNELTALDVSDHASLQSLDCSSNRLTALRVSGCPALNDLVCSDNQLTALDISANTALASLDCSGNRLTALDVSRCTALRNLYCSGNRLTALDVSACGALSELNCSNNLLTSLDLQSNDSISADYAEYYLTLNQKLGGRGELRNGVYCFDLSALVSPSVYSDARFTLCDGCTLNAANGIVTFRKKVSSFYYHWETGKLPMKVLIRMSFDDDVRFLEINETNFPDTDFRTYIIENLEVSGNAETGYYMTPEQIETVMEISPDLWGECCIRDLTGIEHFTELKSLYVDSGPLPKIDLSKNTKLESVEIWNVYGPELDPSDEYWRFYREEYEEWLEEGGSGLRELILGNLPALSELYIGFANALTELDVSGCPALKVLHMGPSLLTELDVRSNPNLEQLELMLSPLTSLDVSNCSKLRKLMCRGCSVTSINLANNPNLTLLFLDDNPIKSVNLRNAPLLESISMFHCDLEELDTSGSPALESLWIGSNYRLARLDMHNNPNLQELYCDYCALTSLNVSGCPLLNWMYCHENRLAVLDLSANTELDDPYFSPQELTQQRGKEDNGVYTFDLAALVGAANLGKVTLADEANTINAQGVVTFPGKVERFKYNYDTGRGIMEVTVPLSFAAPSDVMSTAANFMGKMLVNYYIVMSEEALADKDAYVEIKLNDDVKKVLVRDADTDEKNGVLRHKFEMEVPSKCMRDDIVLKLHAGNGSLLPLTYKQETDVTEGFIYHMVDYLRGRQQNSTSETMRRLAYTAEWYGTACQLYFNHHVNQLTEAEIAAMNTALNDASIMTGLANYAPIEGGTLPNGITKRSNTVVFESDNTLRTYFYTANPGAYTFTMDDNEIHLNEWEAGKYNYDIPNIPGKELAKWHKVTATDGTNTYTYKTSALGYCYGRAANSTNVDMQNLAKTLYLYGKAAMAYFNVPDQPAPADTPTVPDAPAEPVLPESLQGRDIQLPIVP